MTDPSSEYVQPVDQTSIIRGFRLFLKILTAVAAVLMVGGWLYGGLDFLWGILIGYLIVMVNALWTKKVVQSILLDGKSRGLVSASYLLKIGLTGGIIYQAITHFGMDGIALLTGLSAILPSSVIFSLTLKQEPTSHGDT